jgi:flagellar hook protein FlgE
VERYRVNGSKHRRSTADFIRLHDLLNDNKENCNQGRSRRRTMGNFSIALSGLDADSTALNTIGNNLANLNTTAYKGQNTSFEDLFYQQIGQSGSGNPIQAGSGTKVGATTTDFSEGTLLPDANSNTSDMALDGTGFFLVEQNGQQSLTRAGNFTVANNGSLTTQDGQNVLGYPAVNGVVNTNTNPQPITLPVGATEGAQATENISITANLNSGATVGTTFTSPLQVFDSLGQSHQATVTYDKTGTNTWSYAVTLPPGDSTGTPLNNTGTLTFDTNGNLISPTGSVTGISFPGMADGASDLTFNWNLNGLNNSGSTPTITQLASANSNSGAPADGFASGNYTGFTVDPSGVIQAQFSNGNNETIGQVAVATVTNVQGLVAVGGNNFQTTAASGQAIAGVAGTGGRGTVDDNALEQSNVNISTEFSNLIVAQRAFEANSKTVTTFDTISQDVIGMIR